MQQVSIRCHPYAPVSTEELEQWLSREVERLRAAAPQAAFRLLRLTQTVPTGEMDVGWLIELDAAGGEPPFDRDELAAVLRDMRLLGLQPTVLRASSGGEDAVGANVNGGGSWSR
ncbi:MAG: hypothetical protein WD844_04545 [Thermoleophilaceae bacterium]